MLLLFKQLYRPQGMNPDQAHHMCYSIRRQHYELCLLRNKMHRRMFVLQRESRAMAFCDAAHLPLLRAPSLLLLHCNKHVLSGSETDTSDTCSPT